MSADRVVSFAGNTVRWAVTGATVVFLVAPALVIVVLSFSGDSTISFPPSSWSLDRYVQVFTSGRWDEPIALSLRLAATTAVMTVAIALPAVFAIRRGKLRFVGAVENLSLIPLVVPISSYAVAMYAVYAQFDMTGTFFGVALSHVLLSIPLAVIIVGGALDAISADLELAAMTLGASRTRAWLGITLRLLVPAIVAGMLFGFVTSLDEVVMISFLGGIGLTTLPKYILDSIMLKIDPAITAISTLFMLSTTLIMLGALVLRRKKQ